MLERSETVRVIRETARQRETERERKREGRQKESEIEIEERERREDRERENFSLCRWGLGQPLSFKNQQYIGELSLPHV